MLSEELVDLPPKKEYKNFLKDGFFFGFKIKNLYDERRVKINDIYNPGYYKINNTNIYGAYISPNSQHITLLKTIKKQKYFDLIGYCNLLEEYNLSCNKNFYDLQPFLYPVDTENIKMYFNDYSYETFIDFQEEIPNFQQFMSTHMLIVLTR